MKIFIALISGKKIEVEVTPNTEIGNLAYTAYNNRPESQKNAKKLNYYSNIDLFFHGKNLDYAKTLADYNINESSTLVEVGKKCTKSEGFNWDNLTMRKDVASFKREINTIITLYEISGKKFAIYNQDKDRGKVIENMVTSLNSIVKEKQYLFDKDYEAIINVLQTALNETIQSHKSKSLFGFLGITESRWATKLSSYINKLKADQTECHTELGILTTKPLPNQYLRMKL